MTGGQSGRFDDFDRRLLHALQIDGRASFRRIGEVLGVADQTVARRYVRLRSTNALRVVGIIDPEALSEVQWVLRVRATPEAAGKIADALARRSDTSWIALCSGGTEIVGAVHGAGVEPLLLDVLPHSRHVLDVRAQQVLHTFYGGPAESFTKHGTLSAAEVAGLTVGLPAPSAPPPAGMDGIDEGMLQVLRRDGRASVNELVAATRASASTVRRRLHNLRASGVLQLDVDVDPAAFDLSVRTMLGLSVQAADVHAVGQALAGHDEVAFAAATTGPANVFASVVTRDTATLYRYLTTAVGVLPIVGAVDAAPVVRHVKSAATHYKAPRAQARSSTARS